MQIDKIKRIIISRSDNLGDVILTLPMAGILKHNIPDTEIIFIGKTYSQAIIESSEYIDDFINIDDLRNRPYKIQIDFLRKKNADLIIHVFPNKHIAKLAKLAKIPYRIGTSHRLFHLTSCNKLVNLSRKKSDLHEAQLNIKLLKPLGLNTNFTISEISNFYGFNKFKKLPKKFEDLLSVKRFNLILHPKSKGSAREWGLDNFGRLIDILPENKYKIFITGTGYEGELMHNFLEKYSNRVVNLTGKLNLHELISFISKSDGLVAASTGPLHIAAAAGIRAIGIFAPMRPIHPGRWQAIGKKADFIVKDEYCDDCRKTNDCHCIRDISAYQVKEKLESVI
jgi:ADP-heptose:LPS heptosyltransferase